MLKIVSKRQPGADEVSWEIAREFEDPRRELVRLLQEACQVEHSFVLQYLYAAFSVKPRYADALVGQPVARHDTLLGVAIEEMLHFRDVNRMLVELDGAPSLLHRDFPYDPGIYPFDMTLQPLSRASVARYVFAEAPPGVLDKGSAGATPDDPFARAVWSLLPRQHLNHVGSLYRTIVALLVELEGCEPAERLGRWRATLQQIRKQGEHDHFAFFREVFLGTHPAFAGVSDPWHDPAADTYPALALPENPTAVARGPRSLQGTSLELGRLANHAYWALLLLLDLGYRRRGLSTIAHGTAALMTDVLLPVGRALAARGDGMPFDAVDQFHAPGVDAANAALARELLATARKEVDALGGPLGDTALSIQYVLRATDDAVAGSIPARDSSRALGPEVLVVGAGPAGLAAAAALAQRGLRVCLVEESSVVGGKTDSERESGRSREHGVHGWWPSYKNFDRLLADAGVDLGAALRPARGGVVVTGPRRYETIRDLAFRLPSPFFVFLHFSRVSFLGFSDLVSILPFAVHVLAFDHQRDYERYDRLSLTELANRLGVSKNFQKFILRPFALSFDYSPPERVSAASIMSAFQFYVLPTQRALIPRWSNGFPWDRILDPIVRSIEARGGRIECGRTLESVIVRDGTLAGAMLRGTGDDGAIGAEVIASIPRFDVPDDALRAFDSNAGPLLVGRFDGKLCAYAATCTHQGGALEWRGDEIVCQRHGGTFTASGKASGEPAVEDLSPLATRRTGDVLEVLGLDTRREVSCPHVIIATDVASTNAVLRRSKGVPSELMKRVGHLRTTPVVVVRLWLAPGTPVPPDVETAVLPDSRFADIYFHLNSFHPVYDAEGVVIEVHACDPEGTWCDREDNAILEALFEDLRSLCPALTRANLRDSKAYEIRRHRAVFTFYAPGDMRNRPDAHSGVRGLHLAGDWTRARWSVWMMERAVVSGLEAANHVLRSLDREPIGILRPEPDGLVLQASRLVARAARWLFWGGGPPGDAPP